MPGFTQTIKKFPRTFWTANTMEIMERWAWYDLFTAIGLGTALLLFLYDRFLLKAQPEKP